MALRGAYRGRPVCGPFGVAITMLQRSNEATAHATPAASLAANPLARASNNLTRVCQGAFQPHAL